MARDIEDYTKNYLEHNFEEVQVKYRRKKVLEVLNQYKPKNLLEIGCGMDSISNYYKEYDSFVIVEPSDKFCSELETSVNENSNIVLVKDFLENQVENLKDNNFDFIILSGLLHEVINPQLLLDSIFKLCSQNTIVHVNVPNSHSFHMLWAYESGLIDKIGTLSEKAKLLQQNTTFDKKKLNDMVINSGFEVTEEGSYFVKPFNHSKMQFCLKDNILNEKLLDGLYKMVKYMPDLGSELFVNMKVKID